MKVEQLREKNFLSLVVYGMRLKTLVASGFPVILGMLLARFDGFYDISVYLCTLFTAVFLQIGTNYANDYFDSKAGRDTDRRLGPPRVGSLGLISKKVLFSLMCTSFATACILSSYLIMVGGAVILYLILAAVALGVFYSFGKYSLANTGLANAVVFIVFGPLGCLMTYYLQSGTYELKAAFYGIIPGCLSLMMLAMNNLRDMEEDKLGNKKTLAVRFGFDWGKKEYLRAVFLSWLIIPLSMMFYGAPIITLLPFLMVKKAYSLGKKVHSAKTPKDIIPLFEETAKYNVIFALLYIVSWRIATL